MTIVEDGLLERTLRARRAAGRKLLVPYVTGGLDGWREAIEAAAAAGADAVEVGIPFSDPVMDGPVIQEASQRALEAGTTPAAILEELAELDAGIPVAVMTYYNPVFRAGHDRFAGDLRQAGVSAAIVPDLPLEEAGPWCEAADGPASRPSCSPRRPRPTSGCLASASGRGASSTRSACSA